MAAFRLKIRCRSSAVITRQEALSLNWNSAHDPFFFGHIKRIYGLSQFYIFSLVSHIYFAGLFVPRGRRRRDFYGWHGSKTERVNKNTNQINSLSTHRAKGWLKIGNYWQAFVRLFKHLKSLNSQNLRTLYPEQTSPRCTIGFINSFYSFMSIFFGVMYVSGPKPAHKCA